MQLTTIFTTPEGERFEVTLDVSKVRLRTGPGNMAEVIEGTPTYARAIDGLQRDIADRNSALIVYERRVA